MNIREYFWGFNENAIKETEKILKNPEHPGFVSRIFAILSRSNNTKEFFGIIKKEQFVRIWPKIRRYWIKHGHASDFRAWWETVYEQLLKKQVNIKGSGDEVMKIFKYIGGMIKDARIARDWSQNDFAQRVGVAQTIISRIERGTISYSIRTLVRICRALGIKSINIPVQITGSDMENRP